MGFFSWDCRECGKSIRSELWPKNGEERWLCEAVAVFEDETLVKGVYDGYGRINGACEVELQDVGEDFDFYHKRCWEKAGKPREFRGGSRSAQDQGWFVED